jgi:uncharacterized membrane protein
MKRLSYFVILITGSFVAFLLLIVWYLATIGSGNASFAGVMGQMMGNQYAAGMTSAMPTYVWLGALVLVVLILAGVAGLAYFVAFPEIRTGPASVGVSEPAAEPRETARADWTVLLRTSNPEEKRILEVLASHDGKYLQKFIVKDAGLSRLKTHRIISRFAERGVVTATKSGNTNEIILAPWLIQDATSAKSKQ